MAEYDFSTLSPIDFEMLVCQLLRARSGWELEAFGHGPDGGVDLRCTAHAQKIVVQCKHYRGSTFSDLRKAARREVKNMVEQQPGRYLFATSQDLSLTQKDSLKADLHPWLTDTSDILAMRDLNILLGEHPAVENSNFKLWMASAGVLRRIVNSGLWERSEALMEEIQDRIRVYVSTKAYAGSLDMLAKNRVCVITGAPGVGKSMLADMLALTHWEQGWQIVSLASHETDRCWDAWHKGEPQFFYFDDVFGQTDIHERLGKDAGSTLARFIRRVGGTPKKRLVITTRTHILQEAEMRDEPVARSGLRARECVVQVRDYGTMQRAKVLYNHLYFSELARSTVREFLSGKGYWQVIKHRGFAPRIIEQVILHHEENSDKNLLERMLEALDHPLLLWGPSFREALSPAARSILMQLITFPPPGADVNALRSAAIGIHSPMEYTRAIKQLEGSWISIGQVRFHGPVPLVSFSNPSCRDFVLAFLDSEPDYLWDVLANATEAAQIALMLGYCSANAPDNRAHKYPNLHDAVIKRLAFVSERVRGSWPDDCSLRYRTAAKTLHAFSEVDQAFGLGLDEWIRARTYKLSEYQSPNHVLDPEATGKLLLRLASTDQQPRNEAERKEFIDTINEWCSTITEGPEWDNCYRIYEWIFTWPDDTTDEVVYATFCDSFTSWARDELRSALENADDSDDAESWASEIDRQMKRYFGFNLLREEFDSFMQDVHEKFDRDYDPSLYDPPKDVVYTSILEAVDVYKQGQPTWTGGSTHSRNDVPDIENLFRQLE